MTVQAVRRRFRDTAVVILEQRMLRCEADLEVDYYETGLSKISNRLGQRRKVCIIPGAVKRDSVAKKSRPDRQREISAAVQEGFSRNVCQH